MFKNNTGRKVFNPTDIHTSKIKLKISSLCNVEFQKYIYIICPKIAQVEIYLIQRISIPPKQNLHFVFIRQRTQKKVYIYYISPLRYIQIKKYIFH